MRRCIDGNQHVGVEERARERNDRDAGNEGEARRGKPTREVCVSATDRIIYGDRCRDLNGQPVRTRSVDWLETGRSLPHTHIPERSEAADACVT